MSAMTMLARLVGCLHPHAAREDTVDVEGASGSPVVGGEPPCSAAASARAGGVPRHVLHPHDEARWGLCRI